MCKWNQSDSNTEWEEVQDFLLQVQQIHWRRFKNEAMVAVFGAYIYQTWLARNRKFFQGYTVQNELSAQQIHTEFRETVDLLRGSKKARRCSHFF